MLSKRNVFENLDEIIDDRTTNNVVRKAKKKLREIETIKQKSSITDEEKDKLRNEKFWISFLPPKKKLVTRNKYGITHSLGFTLESNIDCCPICINEIPNNRAIKTNCNHFYCNECTYNVISYTKTNKCVNCSLCRATITKFHFQHENDMLDIMHKLAFNK